MDKLANKEKYEVLLEAIDFFTQRFHIRHLLQYSLDFTVKLLKLNNAALFVRSGHDYFEMQEEFNFGFNYGKIKVKQSLIELPLYSGRIITSKFHQYLPSDFIDQFDINMIIPLINDTELQGFIVTNGNGHCAFSKEEVIFTDILLKLINTSIENNLRLLEAQQIKSELDHKIFDLFVINQSTKALLAELDMENLYDLATDVFSEVSGSKVTSFGILDETTSKIKIVGYRNVNSFHTYYTEFTVSKNIYPPKMVLHVHDDESLLKEIFLEWDRFQQLDAQYVVLIFNDEIMGIVTLGECRTKENYDTTVFELIQTLSSATCTALTNAKLFQTISQQKQEIEDKFHTLEVFNKLSRNINACETEEELIALALQTIELAFGVEKAFFAKQLNENEFIIKDSIGADLVNQCLTLKKEVYDNLNDTLIQYESQPLDHYISERHLINSLGQSNGIIISPVLFRNERVILKERPAYLLVITSTQERLKQEDVLIMDTLTKNIRPILFHLNRLKDDREKFLDSITEKLSKRKIDPHKQLFIYWQKTNQNPFIDVKKETVISYEETYRFNGYEFIISEQEIIGLKSWNEINNPMTLNEMISVFS